jgi:hypothetical protein
MIRWHLAIFSAAFLTSAGWENAGCTVFGGGDDCNCPPPKQRPTAQEPIGGLSVSSYDNVGNEVPSEVDPDEGSIEVNPDDVVIRYQQAGVQHEVRYTVLGP